MDVKSLHTELKAGKLNNLYIFAGEEWKVQEIYINQIAKMSCKEKCHIDKFTDIPFNKKSSFIKSSYVYIARDDKEFMTQEKLQDNFDRLISDNIFILILSSVDKRLKFSKRYRQEIVSFEKLDAKLIERYVAKQSSLDHRAIVDLIEVCDQDYGRILLELDKIHIYAKIHNLSESQCLYRLINDGCIYVAPQDAIFDVVDSVLDGNADRAWQLYEDCKEIQESPLALISVLYTNIKAVLQVQSCSDSTNICGITGLTSWQVKNASKHCNHWKNRDLIRFMDICRECEQGIKTGRLRQNLAVDYTFIKIFSPVKPL